MSSDGFRSLMAVPVVGAPLSGGASTPELAAAVSEAGGFGFLAAGYKTAVEVQREIEHVRTRTQRRFGVNLFFPTKLPVDETAVTDYVEGLAGEAERYGVPCGDPRWSDDEWERKLELVARERPAVVSFTFGCPASAIVSQLRGHGIAVWCTVTRPAEAEAGTSPPHRAAFNADAPTALTRAFTGRRARGIVNRFMRDHDAAAPKAYPHVHHLTAPLRAAARAAGDAEGINLWAGQAYPLAEAEPAATLVARWGAEADAVLRRLTT